jgi:hypothetical protein
MTWTVSNSGSNILTTECRAVAYGNGLWVAGGEGTNTLIYSEDGMTWTASTNGSSITTPSTVAYGNGLWVAGGAGAYTLAYSADGITWTGSTSGTSIITPNCYAVSYSGKWIAGGSASTLAYSTDGITWRSVVTVPITTTVQAFGSRSLGTARVAQTTFNNDYDSSGTIIPNRSVLTDSNDISGTRVIESIYNGTGKRLYLSGKTGATDTSNHIQDASNNFIGKDLSGNYMHGSIKEMLVYNTAHTDAERKQVETYLKAKWSSIGYTPTGTSLWLDGASAINFELSGNRIKTWNDKSSANLDMSQNLVWTQPRYSLDSVTGRYGVQFGSEGITTGFTTPSSPFGNTNSWSVFTVQRYDFSSNEASDLPGNTVCNAYDISGEIPRFGIGTQLASTPSSSELYFMNSMNNNTATVEIHKSPVLTSQVVNSLSYNDYYNGISFTNTTLITSMTTNSILNMGFSGTITPALAGSMRGYIYEFIAYNRPVATAEQQAVEGYLAWKWGLQDSLAPTHPYYVAPPQAGPFVPLLISGAVLWLDGADAITIDLYGSTVTRWADKSGLGNNATAFGSLTYSSNSLVFDGSTTGFTTPYTSSPSSETVFIVMKFNTTDLASVLDGNGSGSREFVNSGTNMQINSGGVAGGPVGTNTIPTATTILYDYTLDTVTSMYYNGTFDISGSTPPFTGGPLTSIGCYYNAGYPTFFMNGSISELIIYNRVLTTVERQKVEGYLAWKWSLQANLPVGHPYKNAAP